MRLVQTLSALALTVLLLAPVACSSHHAGGGTGPLPPPGSLSLLAVGGSFSFPVLVTAPVGDPRLFVVEKGGQIHIVKGGSTLPTPFLDIHTLVSTGGEQGLLGLAFDPSYSSNGRFFVSYTNTAGNSRILRYHVSGNPDIASPTADDTLIAIAQPADNHNGGMITFGPDGMLYCGFGDGGGYGDTFLNGQSKDDLLGSILRLDVRGASGYVSPPDNPFSGAGDMRELWDIGLRNPWRFSFDRANGDLYIGDVGQDDREEIDVSPTASGRGRGTNYGWNLMEGTACFPPGSGCSSAGLTLPVLDYTHGQGCSVLGGFVYRGSAIPGLQGTYFYGDYCSHFVRSFRWNGAAVTEKTNWPSLDPGSEMSSFGQDSQGELYVLTVAGGVYRIVTP